VLRWLPPGTHQFGKQVRPEELERALADAGMRNADRTGVVYSPLSDRWQKSRDMDVNYMVLTERAPAQVQPGSISVSGKSPPL
jgi:2-polyprenyl-6-hydroxyphenyl methylase/3-demethylubiquinone-9 3-methyltransferase